MERIVEYNKQNLRNKFRTSVVRFARKVDEVGSEIEYYLKLK
jgi:hypothetical protein